MIGAQFIETRLIPRGHTSLLVWTLEELTERNVELRAGERCVSISPRDFHSNFTRIRIEENGFVTYWEDDKPAGFKNGDSVVVKGSCPVSPEGLAAAREDRPQVYWVRAYPRENEILKLWEVNRTRGNGMVRLKDAGSDQTMDTSWVNVYRNYRRVRLTGGKVVDADSGEPISFNAATVAHIIDEVFPPPGTVLEVKAPLLTGVPGGHKGYGDRSMDPIAYAKAHGWYDPAARFTIVKYVTRAGLKDPQATIEDLEKARFYLDDLISYLKEQSDARG